jgi:hypothetical protein
MSQSILGKKTNKVKLYEEVEGKEGIYDEFTIESIDESIDEIQCNVSRACVLNGVLMNMTLFQLINMYENETTKGDAPEPLSVWNKQFYPVFCTSKYDSDNHSEKRSYDGIESANQSKKLKT